MTSRTEFEAAALAVTRGEAPSESPGKFGFEIMEGSTGLEMHDLSGLLTNYAPAVGDLCRGLLYYHVEGGLLGRKWGLLMESFDLSGFVDDPMLVTIERAVWAISFGDDVDPAALNSASKFLADSSTNH